MTREQLAIIAHYINMGVCVAYGDMSQKSWTEADSYQRTSAVRNVSDHLDNPNLSPRATHETWMKFMLAGGWVYGPVKDLSLRQHPDLVPYERLNESGRVKDHVFVALVNTLRSFVEDAGNP